MTVNILGFSRIQEFNISGFSGILDFQVPHDVSYLKYLKIRKFKNLESYTSFVAKGLNNKE